MCFGRPRRKAGAWTLTAVVCVCVYARLQAQALEGMMTLLLQVVYVSMTMLFAMHVIATLLYRVGQRAWSQVYSSPDEAVARREVSVQREAVVQRVVDLRGAL